MSGDPRRSGSPAAGDLAPDRHGGPLHHPGVNRHHRSPSAAIQQQHRGGPTNNRSPPGSIPPPSYVYPPANTVSAGVGTPGIGTIPVQSSVPHPTGHPQNIQQQYNNPNVAPLPPKMPQSAVAPPHDASAGGTQYRPLNVKDALSYLDQVKIQFGDQPEVYNRFLDIMKDFKSQAIDTPGVIERVSGLFRGHPNLITGFNTFLPPGYKIEPTNNPADPVRVTTPNDHPAFASNHADGFYQKPLASGSSSAPGIHTYVPASTGTHPHTPSSAYGNVALPPLSSISAGGHMANHPLPYSNVHNAPAPGPAVGSPHHGQPEGVHRATAATPTADAARQRGPVEFNHAINYVNKIKNRFSAEPETYKNFLEILQTYQKEQKPIQEVYAQVQQLFKGAPDLLDEFKQFLPDNSSTDNQAVPVGNGKQYGSSAPQTKKQPKRSTTTAASANNYAMSYAPPSTQSLPPPKKKAKTNGRPDDKPATNTEELEFFEKCKRVIGNKTSYNEFLKILNLFSQEIIDAKTLIERIDPFLSRSPDLLEWFKKFVKYEEDEVVYNIPAERPEIDLQTCRRSGHSYRKLPKHIPRLACSGRDELCKETLNDDWISHPVYVSETGFVAHKKTLYEEAMYKCEEERYEFDLNIEANLHVISLLEPIAKHLQSMTPDERAKFTLPSGLGGTSVSIYQRVIKKIYDLDRGEEVIEALHQSPAVAVPVVLKRLKQKNEEWKRSQREWNKVWREIDYKNFAKALDHQGIHFKAADRKALLVKSLVTEIEVLQREQREKRSSLANRYQFDFAFKKLNIFGQIRRLLMHYIEGNMSISAGDEERVREFLKMFVKRFFLIEDVKSYDDEEDPSLLGDKAGNEKPTSNQTRRGSQSTQSRRDNELEAEAMEVDPQNKDETLTAATTTGATDPSNRKRTSYSLYANTAIYAFFRLYQMLFSRLLKMKELSDELENVPTRSDVLNATAVELGLQTGNPPSFTQKSRYLELIKLIYQLIDNDADPNDFEERVRGMYWTSGYLVFTIDRLIQSIVKQLQIIVSDTKSIDLINLYYRDREKPSTSSRQEAVYRMSADSLIQDENTYRLEFFVPERVLTIQLLGKEDHIADDSISSEEKWSLYVDQFVQLSTTEGLSLKHREPFLRRSLPKEVPEDPPTNVETRSGLELKICVNTYKIFFVDNTEDFFRRKKSDMIGSLAGLPLKERLAAETRSRTKRNEKFGRWLDGESGWKKSSSVEEAQQRESEFERLVKGNAPSDTLKLTLLFESVSSPLVANLPAPTSVGSQNPSNTTVLPPKASIPASSTNASKSGSSSPTRATMNPNPVIAKVAQPSNAAAAQPKPSNNQRAGSPTVKSATTNASTTSEINAVQGKVAASVTGVTSFDQKQIDKNDAMDISGDISGADLDDLFDDLF